MMTCQRIGWTIDSATSLVTDVGTPLNLLLDPPKVVIQQVFEAVQRWRWKRVEVNLPQLARNGSGRGPFMEPIWQLLKPTAVDKQWTPAHQGCLRSVAANRQYTQARVKACGWSEHDRCLLCLSDIVDADDLQQQQQEQQQEIQAVRKRTARDPVKATAEQILKAPRGDLIHRNWECKRTKALRSSTAPDADVRAVADVDLRGHPTWDRGLTIRPTEPLRRKSPVETFNWHIKPRQLPIVGHVYPDGSSRDGPIPELERCGWAFAIVDDSGELIAAAYGVPPPWITDIGGSEAWGLFQALLVTLPPLCKYWPDCLPVKTAVEKGAAMALDPRNPLARVHGMIHTALEGSETKMIGWMPAHLTSADLARGTARKSDGSLVNQRDLWTNDVADKLAKLGVEHHRVPAAEVKRWKAAHQTAKDRAKWVGIVTHAAGNATSFPFRDSEASRWKADAARRARANKKSGTDGRKRRGAGTSKPIIPRDKGGHDIVPAESGLGWLCTVCRCRSTRRRKIATSRCEGVRQKTWADVPRKGPMQHSTVISGCVIWCTTCGCFAESRAQRLVKRCRGPPPVGSGGMRRQILRLRAGVHPVTGMQLPAARNEAGELARGHGKYARLQVEGTPNAKLVHYVPEEFSVQRKPSGLNAAIKVRLRLGRIQCKAASTARRLRLQRRSLRKEELNDVINSFIEKVAAKENLAPPVDVDNDDVLSQSSDGRPEADFWANFDHSYTITPSRPRLAR